MDIINNREVDRKEIYLDSLSITERMTILLKSGVSVVICGGISDVMENMIVGKKIDLFSNIIGEVEYVLKAYLANELDQSQFKMHGFQKAFTKKGTKARELHNENH